MTTMTLETSTTVADAIRAQGLRAAPRRLDCSIDGKLVRRYYVTVSYAPLGSMASPIDLDVDDADVDAIKLADSVKKASKKSAKARAKTAYYTRFLPR